MSFLIHISIKFAHDLRWKVWQAFCYIMNKAIALWLLKFFFIFLCDLNNSPQILYFYKFVDLMPKSAC